MQLSDAASAVALEEGQEYLLHVLWDIISRTVTQVRIDLYVGAIKDQAFYKHSNTCNWRS